MSTARRNSTMRTSMTTGSPAIHSFRFAPHLIMAIVIAAATSACGAPPSEHVADSDDAITESEYLAGQDWIDRDGTEPDGIGDDDAHVHPPSVIPHEIAPSDAPPPMELDACHAATGYVRGRAFTLCVTYIDGKPVENGTAAAFVRMRAAAARSGIHIRVVSGFRTMAEQRALYRAYKNGTGNLAAPPGYSNHQSGHALDLNTSSAGVYSWLAHHGAAYGFKRTVPSEAWHWEHW
jgi:hypothetical protein